jgi:hypothetical protein
VQKRNKYACTKNAPTQRIEKMNKHFSKIWLYYSCIHGFRVAKNDLNFTFLPFQNHVDPSKPSSLGLASADLDLGLKRTWSSSVVQ